MRLYVYPCRDPKTSELITAENLEAAPGVRHLYAHLLAHKLIVPITEVEDEHLDVFPKEVLRLLQSGNPAWEQLVPALGVRLIKHRRVFGYQSEPDGTS